MPAAMVKKWASDIGMSNKEAERRWRKAKRLAGREGKNPDETDNKDDWKYVVGIYKTMMKKRDLKPNEMVSAVVSGVPVAEVVGSSF